MLGMVATGKSGYRVPSWKFLWSQLSLGRGDVPIPQRCRMGQEGPQTFCGLLVKKGTVLAAHPPA